MQMISHQLTQTMKIKRKKKLKEVKVKRKWIWYKEINGEVRFLCFATIKYRMEQVLVGSTLQYKWVAVEWNKRERPHNKRSAVAGAANRR